MVTPYFRSTATHPGTGHRIEVDWAESLSDQQVLEVFAHYVQKKAVGAEMSVLQREVCHIWEPDIIRDALRGRTHRLPREGRCGSSGTAPRRFVVLSDMRSGSTWLHLLLDRHPRVVCKGELLHPAKIDRNERYFDRVPEHLEDCLWRKHRHCSAVGFKMLYPHCAGGRIGGTLMHPSMIEYISRQNLFVIHLIRKNVLDKVLSHALARHFQTWGWHEYPVVKLRVEAVDLCKAIKRHHRWRSEVPCLIPGDREKTVYYEDVCTHRSTELGRLFSFLGVEPVEVAVNYPKQRVHSQRAFLENFDELKAAFANGPHAWMFEE